MSTWMVEVDDDLTSQTFFRINLDLEIDTIQRKLEVGGPDALGESYMDIEGFPGWGANAGVISLQIPVFTGIKFKLLHLEVGPGFYIRIIDLSN